MALSSTLQEDFGGGMYRGRRAPGNAFYDGVNALINDEGLPFKRGGSAYKSNADAAATLIGAATFALPAGDFTLFWSAGVLYKLDTDDATPVAVTLNAGAQPPDPFVRGVSVASSWIAPGKVGVDLEVFDGTSVTRVGPPGTKVEYVAAVGSGTNARLIATYRDKAFFSDRGAPTTFTAGNYHQMPAGGLIIGADGVGDTGLLFTSEGIWSIANMSLDPIDDFGNVQHAVSQVNRDLILWGDPGIAGWRGALIVPATDDVWLFSLGTPPQPITGARGNQYDGGIRSLYRSYVKAGYQPGLAAVHRGHYWLPILNGSTWVDTLVCRLDHGFAWTRWDGHAAGGAYVSRVSSGARSPKLFGAKSLRLTDLSSTLDPTSSNAQDADATNFDCTITTRDYPTQQAHGFVQRARLRYELTDDGSGATAAPTVALAYSSDADAGAFSTLTDKGLQAGGTGGAVSAGDKYNWWTVGKKRERIRFKITQTGAAASFILRSLEMLTRQSGRQ